MAGRLDDLLASISARTASTYGQADARARQLGVITTEPFAGVGDARSLKGNVQLISCSNIPRPKNLSDSVEALRIEKELVRLSPQGASCVTSVL